MSIKENLSNCRTNIANMEAQLAEIGNDGFLRRTMIGLINLQKQFEYDLVHGHNVTVNLIKYDDEEQRPMPTPRT